DRRALDGEEPDQVLRRRQRHHVSDPFIVGPAGLLGARIPLVAGGLGRHGKGSSGWIGGIGNGGRKNAAGGRPAVLGFGSRSFGYALASPPPVRCENLKYAKKNERKDMPATLAREFAGAPARRVMRCRRP